MRTLRHTWPTTVANLFAQRTSSCRNQGRVGRFRRPAFEFLESRALLAADVTAIPERVDEGKPVTAFDTIQVADTAGALPGLQMRHSKKLRINNVSPSVATWNIPLDQQIDNDLRIGRKITSRLRSTQPLSLNLSDGDLGGGPSIMSVPPEVMNLSIHNGQFGDVVPDHLEETVGAFTVANLNDTDGDGIQDMTDDVVVANTQPVKGVDEIDLMRLVVDRPTNYVPGTAVEIIVHGSGPGAIKFWELNSSTRNSERV